MIFSASVLPDRVQVQAGVVTLEMSSTREMSLPATGVGTDGVIATSLAVARPGRHHHRRDRVARPFLW